MKRLLNTLFVLSEDVYLALDGENVVLWRSDEQAGRFPLHTLQDILCFSYKGASPALMGKCVRDGRGLAFFTPSGRFLARADGLSGSNILLRRAQYRVADDEKASCRVASGFILGKVYNSRWLLERATRDHPMRVDVQALKQASAQLKELLPQIEACQTLESLRGLEGKAAACYFGVLDQLILQNSETFSFSGRNRRPPLDPMNALLSFLYTLLANDCASALEGVGLDSQAGFLHRDRPGRSSLALDLMEQLRPVMADRLALTLVNSRQLGSEDFRYESTGAVFLSESGRKIVLKAWQERKKEEMMHPFLQEKMPWGLVSHIQALLLARYLRGDLDGYPPLFWK